MEISLSKKIASWIGDRPDEWILKEWLKDALILESCIPKQTTLRDQFAMAALNTLELTGEENEIPDLAEDAYRIADAMMKARGETNG